MWASYAIILAGVFDVLDGRVARIIHSQTKFGVEYDSISDVISFGLAPSILAYSWALNHFGRIGFAAAFFFAACGALRLARFNTVSDELPRSYFIGLPIPGAALMVSSMTIAQLGDFPFEIRKEFVLIAMFVLGLLMVSTVRYRAFKDIDVKHKRDFFMLVFAVIAVALVAIKPDYAILIIMTYYVLWAPIRESIIAFKKWVTRKPVRKVMENN